MATGIILALILGYCGFLIYRAVRNKRAGKAFGCGCSGACSSCPGACKGSVRTVSGAEKQDAEGSAGQDCKS